MFSAIFKIVRLMLKFFDFGGRGSVWRVHRDLHCQEKTIDRSTCSEVIPTHRLLELMSDP
nr:hypothetical protein [uncultured Brevundimonas sp.]